MTTTKKPFLLVRAPYPYGRPQVWLPVDLLNVAARMHASGIESRLVDLNITALPETLDDFSGVGIGIIGPPYIPGVQQLVKTISEKTDAQLLLGGPVVEHLSSAEFQALYPGAVQIVREQDLSHTLGAPIPSPLHTSITHPLEQIPKDRLKEYLTREFSFFMSQGCKYACDFCAADRSRTKSPVTERFSTVMENDLDTLCKNAVTLGVHELSMYLSSLDLFQTPAGVAKTLDVFARARKEYGVTFKLRGLSRVDSFLRALEAEPSLHTLIPRAGLATIGFGVDGASEEQRRTQHKSVGSISEIDDAYARCKALGITPEALLVMGYHVRGLPAITKGRNIQDVLDSEFAYAMHCAEQGVITRPHVAKDMVPGNSGWTSPVWARQRAALLHDPKLFKNLDYVALASHITHPDPAYRATVNKTYLRIIETLGPSGLCATSPLLPYGEDRSTDAHVDAHNASMQPDR